MKITGSYTFHGPKDKVWPLIYDPAALMELIPGCERLEQVSSNEYRGRMQVRFPGVTGSYNTYVKILERRAPHSSRFQGEVDGPAGSIKGTASFQLDDLENQQTVITYEGQAMISGALSKLSPRFVEGIAQTLLKQGLAALETQVQSQAAAPFPAAEAGPSSFWGRLIERVKRWNRA